MVEEKARSLLPRHNFASLSYYINEYGSRGMTIDAFVSVLLEMLDTPEKVSVIIVLCLCINIVECKLFFIFWNLIKNKSRQIENQIVPHFIFVFSIHWLPKLES